MVIKMASETTNLETAALKRKEKLNALKRKRDGTSDKDDNTIALPLPKPIFRSYKPQDEKLKENALPQAEPINVEDEVQDQLKSSEAKEVIDELDIANLAPRKPDWDLKRDVSKKLEKLERRTQRAIAELIRERLKEREEDLATLVNTVDTESKLVK